VKDFTCFKVQGRNLHTSFKARSGSVLRLSKDKAGVSVGLNKEINYLFSPEFPMGKKVFCIDWDDRYGIIYVQYFSVWPEFRAMCYGASVGIIHQNQIVGLPNVLPTTVIYVQRDQVLISQVEKGPFGVPCAALLPLEKITSGEDLESLYVFPGDKPLIVEGFATTAAPGRIHRAENIPGTGACYGDVPGVYAWISPDQKQHGWVFTPYGRWEIVGKDRPKDWLDDRLIYHDPIWHDNGDEVYTLMLGNQGIEFPSLPLNVNGEITRFQIERAMRKPVSK
jgi:hypothetical protein